METGVTKRTLTDTMQKATSQQAYGFKHRTFLLWGNRANHGTAVLFRSDSNETEQFAVCKCAEAEISGPE